MWLEGIGFGKTAEALGKLTKGNLIVISGALEQESWNDKTTGAPRTKTVLKIDRFDQLDRKDGLKPAASEPGPSDVPAEDLYGEGGNEPGVGGEIPF